MHLGALRSSKASGVSVTAAPTVPVASLTCSSCSGVSVTLIGGRVFILVLPCVSRLQRTLHFHSIRRGTRARWIVSHPGGELRHLGKEADEGLQQAPDSSPRRNCRPPSSIS